MDIFKIILLFPTLLCSLVAGFLFAFAIIVMPGLKAVPDREFIRAFQVMDGVIQRKQPLFMAVWVGSVVTLIISGVLGSWQLDYISKIILWLAGFIYIIGVQLPTITINIPLNNRLQTIDTSSQDTVLLKQARQDFESRWNFWNAPRTVLASLVSVVLIVLLLMSS